MFKKKHLLVTPKVHPEDPRQEREPVLAVRAPNTGARNAQEAGPNLLGKPLTETDHPGQAPQ